MTWSCQTCTYINENENFLACEMCGDAKPDDGTSAAKASPAAAAASAVDVTTTTDPDEQQLLDIVLKAEEEDRLREQQAEEEHRALIDARMKEIIMMQQEMWDNNNNTNGFQEESSGSFLVEDHNNNNNDIASPLAFADPEVERQREAVRLQEEELRFQQERLELEKLRLDLQQREMELNQQASSLSIAPTAAQKITPESAAAAFAQRSNSVVSRPGAVSVTGGAKNAKMDKLSKEYSELEQRQREISSSNGSKTPGKSRPGPAASVPGAVSVPSNLKADDMSIMSEVTTAEESATLRYLREQQKLLMEARRSSKSSASLTGAPLASLKSDTDSETSSAKGSIPELPQQQRRESSTLRELRAQTRALRSSGKFSPADMAQIAGEVSSDEEEETSSNLPIRKVYLVFTDVVGSTSMYEAGEEAALQIVQEHFKIIFSAFEASGRIVKTIGDAVMGAFTSGEKALFAVAKVLDDMKDMKRPDGTPFQIRIGMHAGPALLVPLNGIQDYFGRTVNVAARVESKAVGGECLVSEGVLTDTSARKAFDQLLADGYGFTRTETMSLKGVPKPVTVRGFKSKYLS